MIVNFPKTKVELENEAKKHNMSPEEFCRNYKLILFEELKKLVNAKDEFISQDDK